MRCMAPPGAPCRWRPSCRTGPRWPRWPARRPPPQPCLRAEINSAFDDPPHTALGVQVYRALAGEFNRLQAADPKGDGVVAHAFGQFLSAALRLSIPLPAAGDETPQLGSTMRNLRAAAATTQVDKLVHPDLTSHIGAQAAIPSDHTFYLCAEGNGLVHAHRVKLM